jgi:hypothetical protein
MYSYPLKFKAGQFPANEALTILDAKKNEILFRPKLTDAMEDGKTPCIIFSNKDASQVLYSTLHQREGEKESDLIKTKDGAILGKLVAGTEHAWEVLDANEKIIATIQEKSHWKNSCLFEILTFPFDSNDRDTYLKMLSPHRYEVSINGKKILNLREDVSAIRDDYNLKKSGEFSDQQEALFLVSLIVCLSRKLENPI